MMEVAPFSVDITTVSSTALDPLANLSNSNTPTGLERRIKEKRKGEKEGGEKEGREER